MNFSSTLEYCVAPTLGPEVSEDFSLPLIYASGLAAIAYSAFKFYQAKTSPLTAIPTIGYSGILTSYITAIKFTSNGSALLQEGYEKFNGKPFKVASLARWIVVLGTPQHIQDLSVVSDEVMSISKPTAENNAANDTFGPESLDDPYHLNAIRGPVTRNIGNKFDNINDEVINSLREYVPLSKDWAGVPANETLLHMMCRTSNRFLLGTKLARDPQFQNLSERVTGEFQAAGRLLIRCPGFLRPVVSKYFTRVKATLKECREILGPMIIKRLEHYEKKERISEKTEETDDALSWFIETSPKDRHLTADDICRRVMMTNVASLHTTTMVLVQVMYDLAVHPEYVKELREEAENIIAEYGWTKQALYKLHKIDSFMKESHRMNVMSHYLMIREALQDFRLTDGTLIPAGAHVGIASGAINMDEKYYQDATTFKGLRFAEMREGDDELDPIRHQLVSLSAHSVMFGHGKHACPGRFFAVTLIKTIITHVLLEYDVQLENGSLERPENLISGTTTIPNTQAKLYFRERRYPDEHRG